MLRRSTTTFAFSSAATMMTLRRSAATAARPCMGSALSLSSCAMLRAPARCFHSLSLEQAMRITAPSVQHPATGAAPKADPHDPTVVWREHWDVEFERPYYHNLVTNEVRTTLPEGFPTRFLFYYERKHGGVKHEASDAGAVPQHVTRAQSVKARIKEFGLAGFLLYGVIHFGFLGVIFLVMLSGVDLTGILKSLGFEAHRVNGKSIWALWLAAVVTNKIFVPLQALLTVALAPRVAPLIRVLLARFGIKG
jgi:hypothetical protein